MVPTCTNFMKKKPYQDIICFKDHNYIVVLRLKKLVFDTVVNIATLLMLGP